MLCPIHKKMNIHLNDVYSKYVLETSKGYQYEIVNATVIKRYKNAFSQ